MRARVGVRVRARVRVRVRVMIIRQNEYDEVRPSSLLLHFSSSLLFFSQQQLCNFVWGGCGQGEVTGFIFTKRRRWKLQITRQNECDEVRPSSLLLFFPTATM